MPQITVEYSANMEARMDPVRLVQTVHEAAFSSGLFRLGYGIRTRALKREIYAIADQDPQNGFVAIILRIAPGRSDDDRNRLADIVFTAAQDFLAVPLAETPLALSLEVQQIDPVGMRNNNNLHHRLAAKPARQG